MKKVLIVLSSVLVILLLACGNGLENDQPTNASAPYENDSIVEAYPCQDGGEESCSESYPDLLDDDLADQSIDEDFEDADPDSNEEVQSDKQSTEDRQDDYQPTAMQYDDKNESDDTDHPIIGAWYMIGFDLYDYDGSHVFDLIELIIMLGELELLELPFLIRYDGTVNVHGDEYDWVVYDGMFFFNSEMGGYYAIDGNRLIITRYLSDGSFERRIFERAEHL